MDVTLLGTGSAVPTGERYQTGIVVESDAGDGPLLIDCGAGILHRLPGAGYDPAGIDTVLLTHHHLDHVADLPSLLKARLLLDAPECTVVGPPGTREYLSSFLSIDGLADRTDLTIRERDGSAFGLLGYGIETCGTDHSAPGFAYRIEGVFTFSGDTEASARIGAFADGSSVLVHECAFYEEGRSNHATPAALGEALAGVDVDRVYLTHLYPGAAANAAEIRDTVGGYVDATVHVAEDGERIRIPDGD